ncbi:(2Fe-2S)-binding protein [Roseovarius sp.]|uniref:(2Fe-2S)-binding protein n=1 Tax=Roseovarius sp. TaxID=1486281 RepID=UPI003A979C29
MSGAGRFQRLAEERRASVTFHFDGKIMDAKQGDTVLTAILMSGRFLRPSDSGPEQRAGFCLMGACQDCWIWQEEGPRLRACTTEIIEGMRLRSTTPEGWPEPRRRQ